MNEIIETEAIPVQADLVLDERPPNLSFRFLILLMSGATWYVALFLWVLPLAIAAAAVTGATAYSIRRRGETLLSVSAEFLIDVLGLSQDVLDGFSDGLQNKAMPVLRHSGETLLRYSGMLSASEVAAIAERGGGEVAIPLSVIELIAGTPQNPHNTALLAPSQSGKTTLLHGVINHLITLPQQNIVLVGDPNYGAANDKRLPVWGGLPIYDRETQDSPIKHHQLVIGIDDIYTTLDLLGELYLQRMALAQAKAKQSQGDENAVPMQFMPIYYFIDEFQTFVGELAESQIDRVNMVYGQLIRAAKYRIYFYPVLHNDKAENGINTANLGGVNLLILGSVIDQIGSSPLLNNSRRRFDGAFIEKLTRYRLRYNAAHGKAKSQKMLGAISLVKGFTASNGDEFAPGTHVIKVPNFTDRVNIRHDFSHFEKAEIHAPRKVQTDSEMPPIVAEMGDAFAEWFIENYQLFQAQADWSLTKFFDLASANGWGKLRKPSDPHYAFLQALKDAQGGRIKPNEILEALEV
jgi:hypothetical protein